MNVAIRRLFVGALVGGPVLAPAAGAARAPTTSLTVACFSFNNRQKKGARRPVRPPAVAGQVRRATPKQSGERTYGILRILRSGRRCPPGTTGITNEVISNESTCQGPEPRVHGDQLDPGPGLAALSPAATVPRRGSTAPAAPAASVSPITRSRFESQAEFQMRMSSLKAWTNAPAT